MKRSPLLVFLALLLAAAQGCGAAPQIATDEPPSPTPVVIRETVVVVFTPTDSALEEAPSPTAPGATPTSGQPTSTQDPPINTQAPPTDTQPPLPSPTPLVLQVSEIEGPSALIDGFVLFPSLATDSLFIRVEATNPSAGDFPGAGISHVDIIIFNPSNQEVHRRTERVFAYCSFGGGEPDCNIFRFADTGYVWPETGIPIESGFHTANIVVHSEDPENGPQEWTSTVTFEIRLP